MTILALGRREHLAAQMMHDVMQPVTDAEHRNAQFENLRVGCGSIVVVHRRRPAGKNQPDRLERPNLGEGRGARQDYRKHILLTNAPCYELRILRPEIKDGNCLGVHAPVCQPRRRNVKTVCGLPQGSFAASATGSQRSLPVRNTLGMNCAACLAVN